MAKIQFFCYFSAIPNFFSFPTILHPQPSPLQSPPLVNSNPLDTAPPQAKKLSPSKPVLSKQQLAKPLPVWQPNDYSTWSPQKQAYVVPVFFFTPFSQFSQFSPCPPLFPQIPPPSFLSFIPSHHPSLALGITSAMTHPHFITGTPHPVTQKSLKLPHSHQQNSKNSNPFSQPVLENMIPLTLQYLRISR